MTEPAGGKKVELRLEWASLACGILCWVLSPFVAFGLDVAAIVLGVFALKQADRDEKRKRLIAHIGLWAGVLKLLVMFLVLAWVFVAFMLKPVAH